MEGYIFGLGLRASDKFEQTMKELDKYLRATYSEIRHPDIMTETPATFPDPEVSTTISYSVIKISTTDAEIT